MDALKMPTVRELVGEQELRYAWEKLGEAFDPPLAERIEDYDAFVSKVASNARTFAVYEDAAVVGSISFYVNNQSLSFSYVTELMVAREHQGRGLGTMLVELFEREASRLGFVYARLEVERENKKARNFYERMGYQIVDKSVRGFYMEKELLDAS